MTACIDCGMPYASFPLDATLPDEQWRLINPDERGVLCASCIVRRGAKLGSVVAVRMHFEFASPAERLRACGWTIERFLAPVIKTEACWLYPTKAKHKRATVYLGGGQAHARYMTSHRLSWVLHHGTVPDGLCVLHRCDNPQCVRPDHLVLGTQLENMQDMSRKGRATKYNSLKTHCKRGHAFSIENTLLYERNGKTHRVCRACSRAKSASWNSARRAEVRA